MGLAPLDATQHSLKRCILSLAQVLLRWLKTIVQGTTDVLTPELQQEAAALIGSLGASVVTSTPVAGFYVVAPAASSTPAATIAPLSANPLVGRAYPNYVYNASWARLDDIGVTFQPTTTEQQVQALTQSLGDTIVSPGQGTESYLVEPAAGTDPASALAALYASPLVRVASQNFGLQLASATVSAH